MCAICIEYQKGMLTLREAWRALDELESTISNAHAFDVAEMLREEEDHNNLDEETSLEIHCESHTD